jgi:Abi-like protein.
MRLSLRTKYLSQPRYDRYLIATGSDLSRAKKLYTANIRLAQAFHPVISQFEVILRNSLNLELANHFADPNWIRNQKSGFMDDTSLGANKYLKRQVVSTERKLRRSRITITSGKVISDQTLGFWVALFSVPYYRLLIGKPIHIFPNKPSVENRSTLHQKLEKIRDFRNRVNHCEPICFGGNTINCNEANLIRQMIIDLTGWLDPNLIAFLSKLDNINSKINNVLRV